MSPQDDVVEEVCVALLQGCLVWLCLAGGIFSPNGRSVFSLAVQFRANT